MLALSKKQAILKCVCGLGGNIDGMGSSCYIGLGTVSNTTDFDVTDFQEVTRTGSGDTSNNYYRIRLGKGGSDTDSVMKIDGSTISNNAQNEFIIFNENQSSTPYNVNAFGLYTTATGGTPYFVGALASAITVAQNQVPLIQPGKLSITMNDGTSN